MTVNGESRAYLKRILAWHEMVLDTLGGVELTVVYCTLCGTVIPYESVADGRHITFGTSGFLYRSNKLMFDDETKSLWNTFEGVPVVGSLVVSGVRFRTGRSSPPRGGDGDGGIPRQSCSRSIPGTSVITQRERHTVSISPPTD